MSNEFWSGVAVATESALATAVAATSITKANPAVVAHGGADPAVGDYVIMKVQGMNEINLRAFRVASVVASTSFALEGEDSTDYEAFTSGTFEIITFGNSLSTLTDVSPSGGEPEYTDDSTIHQTNKTQAPVTFSPLTYDTTSKFDATDTTLAALKKDSQKFKQRAVRFTFKSGAIMLFYGYPAYTGAPGGSAFALVTTPLSFAVSAPVTVYAS